MSLLSDARSINTKTLQPQAWREVLLLYPGFHILLFHRAAHFSTAGPPAPGAWISQWGRGLHRHRIHPAPASAAVCLSTTAWAS